MERGRLEETGGEEVLRGEDAVLEEEARIMADDDLGGAFSAEEPGDAGGGAGGGEVDDDGTGRPVIGYPATPALEGYPATPALEGYPATPVLEGYPATPVPEGKGDPDIRGWVDFFKTHREMDAGSIPPEVIREVSAGVSPNEAYLAHRVREYEARFRAAEHDGAMREKAVGSLLPEAGIYEGDPFLEAFDRALTEW